MKRRFFFFAIGLALLGPVACRGDLCVQTKKAVCQCHDPLFPDLDSCIASADVLGCGPLDANVDPCAINPCCQQRHFDAATSPPRDLAAPAADLASAPSDLSASPDDSGG